MSEGVLERRQPEGRRDGARTGGPARQPGSEGQTQGPASGEQALNGQSKVLRLGPCEQARLSVTWGCGRTLRYVTGERRGGDVPPKG